MSEIIVKIIGWLFMSSAAIWYICGLFFALVTSRAKMEEGKYLDDTPPTKFVFSFGAYTLITFFIGHLILFEPRGFIRSLVLTMAVGVAGLLFYWILFLWVTKKYTNFSGRAKRKEFWIFALVYCVLSIVMGMKHEPLNMLLVLALFVPFLAVNVRRLHDIGKSGWLVLINLVPIIGWIYYLYLMIKDSTLGENQYGPNPKDI